MIPFPESAEANDAAVAEHPVVVLGIGNVLLCDEGVGVHALRALERSCADLAGVEFVDGGTLSFTLAAMIEDSSALIVLDASEMKAPPGSVAVFEGERMDEFLGSERKRSVHEVGLLDLMALAALDGRLPRRRALIGIQPQRIDWSETPTQEVAEAIPRACALARELLQRWHG
jgi:hydrogenase maturation protease